MVSSYAFMIASGLLPWSDQVPPEVLHLILTTVSDELFEILPVILAISLPNMVLKARMDAASWVMTGSWGSMATALRVVEWDFSGSWSDGSL